MQGQFHPPGVPDLSGQFLYKVLRRLQAVIRRARQAESGQHKGDGSVFFRRHEHPQRDVVFSGEPFHDGCCPGDPLDAMMGIQVFRLLPGEFHEPVKLRLDLGFHLLQINRLTASPDGFVKGPVFLHQRSRSCQRPACGQADMQAHTQPRVLLPQSGCFFSSGHVRHQRAGSQPSLAVTVDDGFIAGGGDSEVISVYDQLHSARLHQSALEGIR